MRPLGIGTDIIEIARVENAIQRNAKVLNRLFSAEEIEDYRQRGTRMEILAGKFAAKEAVLKAFGTGLRECRWVEIEVLPDVKGKPIVRLKGAAARLAHSKGIQEIMLSISHNRTMTVAYAMTIGMEDTHEISNQ